MAPLRSVRRHCAGTRRTETMWVKAGPTANLQERLTVKAKPGKMGTDFLIPNAFKGCGCPGSEIALVGRRTTDQVQSGVRPLNCRDTRRRAFMEIREPGSNHLCGLS